MLGNDVIFVEAALLHPRDEGFPYSGFLPRDQWVTRFVPIVEVSHDRNRCRIGRPYGELGTRGPLESAQARPELLVQLEMTSLVKEVEVVRGQKGVRPGRRAAAAAFLLARALPSHVQMGVYQPPTGGDNVEAIALSC